jgi:hypothetical protein
MFKIIVSIINTTDDESVNPDFMKFQYIHKNITLRQAIYDVFLNLEKEVKEWFDVYYPKEKIK